MNAWPDYDGGAHKLLSENRQRYIEQSRNTRGGIVAPLPQRNLPLATPSPAPAPHGLPNAADGGEQTRN